MSHAKLTLSIGTEIINNSHIVRGNKE